MIENLKYAAVLNLPDLNEAVRPVLAGASSLESQSSIEMGIALNIPMLRFVTRI